MTATNYDEMTGPELAAAFNAMARARGLDPIKKFKDRATGVRRCLAFASALEKSGTVKKQDAPIGSIVDRFDCKNNNRLRMLRLLVAAMGVQVPAENFLRLPDWDARVKIESAIGGLVWRIKESNLPYAINVEREDGKVVSVGLRSKE